MTPNPKAAEPTIDRSIDQTAKHEHFNGRVCPTCKSADCVGAEPPTGIHAEAAETPSRPGTPQLKHISPAVLEFRISELTESLIDMTKRAVVAEARFKVAEERIEQFEKLTASLALELDKCRAADDEARPEE